jgi:protein O-mannosyl-transferase
MTILAVFLVFLAFFALIVGLHYRGFSSPMVYDARAWIQKKTDLFQKHDFAGVLQIVPARPLFITSIYANFLMTGMDPASFRWTNAALLAAASTALLLLCTTLFTAPGVSLSGSAAARLAVSLFLALVFAVHPLQSFVVLYIWQREAVMACLFFLGALTAYVAGRSNRLGPGVPSHALTAALFLAGMLSKENVITLPAMLLVAEIVLFRQRGRNLRNRFLHIVAITGPPLAAYLVLTQSLGSAESVDTTHVIPRLFDYYAEAGINPVEVALTQSRVLLSYAAMIVAPSVTGLPLVKAEVISRSLWNPPVTAAAVAATLLLAVAGVTLARIRPVASFGILFFFIVSLPEALCIPHYLFFGYRAILPMVGVLLVLGDGLLCALARVKDRWSAPTPAILAACAALLITVYLSAATIGQATRWTPLLFWHDQHAHLPPFSENVQYRPYSDILSNYGEELIASGQFAKAIEVLSQATAIDMAVDPAWNRPDTPVYRDPAEETRPGATVP